MQFILSQCNVGGVNNDVIVITRYEGSLYRITFMKVCRADVSSMVKPSAMFPSGLEYVRTKSLKDSMYLSIGYIHLLCTGPHMNNSCTKWISRWVIMSTNIGGNYLSNINNTNAASSIDDSLSFMSIIFSHNRQKNLLTLTIIARTSHFRTLCTASDNTCRQETCEVVRNFPKTCTKLDIHYQYLSLLSHNPQCTI